MDSLAKTMVTTTFCISGAAITLAGDGVNSNLTAGTVLVGSDFVVDTWIVQAESTINAVTRYNWTDAYGSLNNDGKKILESTAAELAAIKCITYDMSGYTSRVEAEDMINVYRDSAIRTMSLLKDKKKEDFIRKA